MAKKNTITAAEIDKAASGLTMDDFFLAVKLIRKDGVLFHDEEHDRLFYVKVNPQELHDYDNELCEADDSLESILYGVFMAVKDTKHKTCETRQNFNEHYRLNAASPMYKKDKNFSAYMALYHTLAGWLRFWMEQIMEEQLNNLSEEEVIQRCEELDRAAEKKPNLKVVKN